MNESDKQNEAIHPAIAVAGLAALSVAMFARELFQSGDTVRSHYLGDLRLQFIQERAFGFAELANGNLALWNPHIFSGTPYLGSFQSALLYPFNLVYLILPLANAIAVDLALHVFLIGAFMFSWMRMRDVSTPAAFFAAAVLMFGQVTSSRIMAGQLTVVASLAWAPLLFWTVDILIDRPSRKWTLIGIGATSMQLLAGYPVFAFMTASGLAIFCAIRIATSPQRLRAVIALSAVAIAPLFISAAQFWTGMYTMAESVRSGGVSFDYASSYSFPPESLLTLLAPGLFGNFAEMPYWGRWVFWDANAFIGATALFSGVIGFVYAPAKTRLAMGITGGILFVLCLGKYTPAYQLIYDWVPGFSRFRAPGKYLFLVTMIGCVFVAYGMDRLMRKAHVFRAAWIAPGAAGLLFLSTAFSLWVDGGAYDSYFSTAFNKILASPDCMTHLYTEPKIGQAATYAAWNLAGAGAACLVASVAIANAWRSVWIPAAFIVFGIAEVLGVTRSFSATIQIHDLEQPELERFYAGETDDRRILDNVGMNYAMTTGGFSLWGYDPVTLRRYAEFTHWTKRDTEGGIYRGPHLHHPMMDMLRCGYITFGGGGAGVVVREVGNPLPRFLLLRDVIVRESPEAVRDALMDPMFDPRKTVVLEEPLTMKLDKSDERGSVELVESSTDHLILSVDTPSAAILLITDSYSRGWRVVALEGSSGDSYQILPADYTLRAIPLTAGRHRIRVEYAPWPFRVGKWVSIISIIAYMLVAGWTLRNAYAHRAVHAP